MKIKTWLILSYLIVMFLPILALYFLYVSLSDYNEQQEMKEYFHFQEIISEVEPLLEDQSLYQLQSKENFQHLQNVASPRLKIDLYRYDGVHIYSTLEPHGLGSFTQMNSNLFQDINQLKKNPRTYSLKRLVFDSDDRIIGLYEITISRTAWVETSKKTTILMIALFSLFFIGLYLLVFMLIHRKLNKPLNELQDHMIAFADGKELEHRLNPSKDEIGVLITHYEKMKRQIIKSREALKREQKEKEYMVAALTHDLKTPLTVIRTYSEAIQNSKLSEQEKKDYQAIIFDKLDHMKEIIDDLSVFTALQSTENQLNLVRVNGEEFFDMLLTGYEEPCLQKQINLKTEMNVRRSYEVDPNQMVRVIDNLMDNSIRFTPKNCKIWLGAFSSRETLPVWIFPELYKEVDEWRQGETVIIIQNEGQGIRASNLEKVFEPFYQDNESRGNGATSGLGLSIAKMIVEKHGGKINIWSIEEKGTLIACILKERN